MLFNYFNPNGITLVREKIELKWAPDSLLDRINEDTLFNRLDTSSQSITEIDKRLDQEKLIPEEVAINQTENISDEKKNNSPEIKEVTSFPEPQAVTLEQAYKLYKNGVSFVDARDEADFMAGRITGSINIPFDDFDNHVQKLDLLSKEKPMVIYCAGTDCDLSILLGNLLFEQGYKQVYIFFGGWIEWQNANYPFEYSNK